MKIFDLNKQCQGVLCPTCGCSLLRLEIAIDVASRAKFEGDEYYFCCEGCASQFLENPQSYLDEIRDMVICPVCLGEKLKSQTVSIDHRGEPLFFCRCPCCITDFQKNPNHFLDRIKNVSL